jgi:hypothetical protein
MTMWRGLKFFDRFKCESKVKLVKKYGIGARSLARSISGVEGVLKLQNGTKNIDKKLIYSHGPTQTIQEVD